MSMKPAVLVLVFALKIFMCIGQVQHLKPARDFEQYEGMLKEYYDNVFPLLYKGYSEKPIARYTSMPSFSREYAFSIELVNGKNYVVSNKVSENFWYAKNRKKVKILSSKAELTDNLYLKIVDLFELIEEQTKEPKDDLMGLDGVTYFFATTNKNGQIKTGETWSPEDNSLLGRLVMICDSVYALGSGKKMIQIDLANDIDKLLNDFKKL